LVVIAIDCLERPVSGMTSYSSASSENLNSAYFLIHYDNLL